ncbi:MAG: TetR/AcrR family transcriptional regulator [Pyrinomonadaceae bacterium]
MPPTATYEKLLDAAQDVIQVRGFNAFSYGQLATTVGISTASIHHHFPTKNDLGEEVVRRYRVRFNGVLEKIRTECSNPAECLERYCAEFVATMESGGRICLCGMLASDYETLPENIRREVRLFFGENEEWLAAILDKGRRDGVFRFEADASDLAITFFSTLEGAMLDSRMFEDHSRLRRTIECWRGLITVAV